MEVIGAFVDGTESQWLSEKEVKNSFTPLHLDVFHALWETHQGVECRRRPKPAATQKGEEAD